MFCNLNIGCPWRNETKIFVQYQAKILLYFHRKITNYLKMAVPSLVLIHPSHTYSVVSVSSFATENLASLAILASSTRLNRFFFCGITCSTIHFSNGRIFNKI